LYIIVDPPNKPHREKLSSATHYDVERIAIQAKITPEIQQPHITTRPRSIPNDLHIAKKEQVCLSLPLSSEYRADPALQCVKITCQDPLGIEKAGALDIMNEKTVIGRVECAVL
jgi:hypothetical protein